MTTDTKALLRAMADMRCQVPSCDEESPADYRRKGWNGGILVEYACAACLLSGKKYGWPYYRNLNDWEPLYGGPDEQD